MAEKKHQRQKTMGNHQSTLYGLGLQGTSSGPQNQQNSQKKQNFSKKAYQQSSFNKNFEQAHQGSKSIFDDPIEESRYLKFLMKEKFKIFENDQQNEKRLEVLQSLNELIDKWQIDLAINAKKIPKGEAEQRHAHILSFGSFKMGVHFPQTDMDLICVFPSYIQQEDFFKGFMKVLQENPDLEEIIDVIDARVPILKLKYMGFQIDLLFAAVDPQNLESKKQIEKIIKDEQVFEKLSQGSQNSLNGLKATLNLMRSVPNLSKFRNTLRAVKLWAMRRGIYSNQFGYLGGVSYAIMVAKICQDYPDLEMADLLYKFFDVYSEWKWLDPVFIKIGKKKDNNRLNLNTLQVLDGYSQDIMPILTPTSNPKNSAYRVCQFTYNTIIKEFIRGKTIIKSIAPSSLKKCNSSENKVDILNEESKIMKNNSENNAKEQIQWTKLFKKVRFFAQYEHFIKIDILSNEEASHNKWLGYVESQLRRLFQLFSDIDSQISDMRISPKCFKREETKDIINNQFICCDSYFIGIRVSDNQPGTTVNLREQVKDFCNWLEIGRVKKKLNNVRILHYKKSDLPHELTGYY